MKTSGLPYTGYVMTVLDKNGITFSRRETSKIVGGEARLRRLIGQGDLIPTDKSGMPIEMADRDRTEKRLTSSSGKNSRWRFRAGDVLKWAQLSW